MDIATLLIQLLSGAAGGNLAGKALSNLSLGGLGNSLAGLIGGGLGSEILTRALGPGLAVAAGATSGPDLDISTLVTQVLGGGAGGGAVAMGVGLLKQMFQR